MSMVEERVRLTQVTEADLAWVSELECNPAVWTYEESIEADREKAAAKYADQLNSAHHRDYIIRLPGETAAVPIGIAQLWSYVEHRRSWELGFGLLPEYQGRGYGREAVVLLLDCAFRSLGAHKVVGMSNARNERSIHLMEQVGMKREGIFRQELQWKEQWCDQYFYALLESEWLRSKSG